MLGITFSADDAFHGDHVPAWFRAFEADAEGALESLLAGAALLGEWESVSPDAFLLRALEALDDRGRFRTVVDVALEQWISRHRIDQAWRSYEDPLPLATAWRAVGRIVGMDAHLPRAASQLRSVVLGQSYRLHAIGFGRSHDPLAAALFAIARNQTDDSLRLYWVRMCSLPSDEPWYRGSIGVLGLRCMPTREGMGFPHHVAWGLVQLGYALHERVLEGWLELADAQEDWVTAARDAIASRPDRLHRWWRFFHDVRREAIAPPVSWVDALKLTPPRASARSVTISSSTLAPPSIDDVRGVTELLRQGEPSAVAAAKSLIRRGRHVANLTGNLEPLAQSLASFSKGLRFQDSALALAYAEQAVSLQPDLPVAWETLIRVHLTRGSHAEAVRVAELATRRLPFDEWIAAQRVHALVESGRAEDAIAIAQEMASLGVRGPNILKSVAYAHLELGQHERAAELATEVLGHPDARMAVATTLARAQFELGQDDLAYETIDAAMARFGRAGGARGEVITLLLEVRRPRATELARALAHADKSNAHAWTCLIKGLRAQGRHDVALEEVKVARRLFPNSPIFRNLQVAVLAKSGTRSEALEHAQDFADRFPTSRVAAEALINVLIKSGRTQDAIDRATAWVQRDPLGLSMLLRLLLRTQRFDLVEELTRGWTSSLPEHADAVAKGLRGLRTAAARAPTSDLAEEIRSRAVGIGRQADDRFPRHPGVAKQYIWALSDASMKLEAEQAARLAVARFPLDESMHLCLMDLLCGADAPEQAIEVAENALRIDSSFHRVRARLAGLESEHTSTGQPLELTHRGQAFSRADTEDADDLDDLDARADQDAEDMEPSDTEGRASRGVAPSAATLGSTDGTSETEDRDASTQETSLFSRSEWSLDLMLSDAALVRSWARNRSISEVGDLGSAVATARQRISALLSHADASSRAAGEGALVLAMLSNRDLEDARALLTRARERFPASAWVAYAHAWAERERFARGHVESRAGSEAGLKQLVRIDRRFEPVRRLGDVRLAAIALRNEEGESALRTGLGRLAWALRRSMVDPPEAESVDDGPTASPSTISRQWSMRVAQLLHLDTVKGADDVVEDLSYWRRGLLDADMVRQLDVLEQDYVGRVAFA